LFTQKENFGRKRRRWSQTEHKKAPGIGTQLKHHRCHLANIVKST
jgi:hypothetical protein